MAGEREGGVIRTALAEWLIAAGANVDRSKNHYTPLHIASCSNHIDVVRALLAAGANVHATNLDGQTALDIALMHGHTDVVRMLVAARGGAPYLADIHDEDPEWTMSDDQHMVPALRAAREALAAAGGAHASPHLVRLLARPLVVALLGD